MSTGVVAKSLIVLLAAASVWNAWGADMEINLEPVGGVSRMFNRPMLPASGQEREPVVVRLSVRNADGNAFKGVAAFRAEDVFGMPVDWGPKVAVDVPAGGKWAQYDVLLEEGMGYFSIFAQVKGEGETVATWTNLGVIPEPHPGIRKDSLFSSNTSGLFTGRKLDLLQAVGMKVQRAHFQPSVTAKQPGRDGAYPLDFRRQDAAFAEAKAHGLWVLPIAGYSFQGAGLFHRTKLAEKTGMYGPPDDFNAFVKTWEAILRHYPEITTHEVWNEPWIFGWTWAAPPGEYRRLQKMWSEMALEVNPDNRIVVGNSTMFVIDHIEHDPSCWKGLIGATSTHPYGYGTGQPTFRAGDTFRSMDYGVQVSRRMGLKYLYLTEGGTQYATPRDAQAAGPQPIPQNNIENARKAVHYAVCLSLTGGFMSNNQWGIGYGADWTIPNTGFAVMTHFLEDRPVVADIWPEHNLIYGGVFANPKFVTDEVRALPRAKELTARWDVPVPLERSGDKTKVAVIWSYTGPGENEQDKDGTLVFSRGPDLRAFDMSGREIKPKGGTLLLPFNESPVYVTTQRLSVVELRERVGNAVIDNITPVNLYTHPLLRPADQAQDILVRVQNQMNRAVNARLLLNIDGRRETTEAAITIPSGKLADVPVPWPGVNVSPENQYGVTVTVETQTVEENAEPRKLKTVTRRQIVQVGNFIKRAIRVDGSLGDWDGATPVVLDSRMLHSKFDPTEYLLNPNLERPTGTAEEKRIVARVYTAYDDTNVYVAAEVHEDTFECSAGKPVVKRGVELPYRSGMPDGLSHVIFCGDMMQLGFGFRDRVPGHGRQMDDPYAWKGHFNDTDYVYNVHASTEGDMLVRQWGADTHRRNAYQTDKVPGVEPVRGAKIKITRDEDKKLTIYEMAIPRGELKLFDPARGRFRFGFILRNNEGVNGGEMNWSEAAGVFDYWRNQGSFSPTWSHRIPCQTFFGIER